MNQPLKIIPIRGERMEADDYLFILKEFHRLLRRTLNTTAYTLFCAIEDHAGPGDYKGVPAYTCSASHATLADEIKVKRITVQRTMQILVDAGLVEEEDRKGLTTHIRPIVTPEQRAAYLLKGKDVNPTCIKMIQATYPNLFQNDTGDMTTYINLLQPPVSKRYTNGTNLKQEEDKELNTNVFNGEDSPFSDETNRNQSETKNQKQETNQSQEPAKAKDPPLDKQGTMLNRFKTAYLAVGSDPANHNKRCGVIGDAWEEITGKKRDYKFISKVMRDDAKGVGWKIIEALLGMANKDITEDPEGYLRRILQNGNGQQRGSNLARNGIATNYPAISKSIKPRGSSPDGGFSRSEFLEEGY